MATRKKKATKAKRPSGGQPEKYKPEYCEQIIKFMSKGKSLTAFSAKIGVTKKTVYNWEKRHPEFERALALAKAACEAWWEEAGQNGMFMGGPDQPFQASIWKFFMGARFGWNDRPQLDLKDVADAFPALKYDPNDFAPDDEE